MPRFSQFKQVYDGKPGYPWRDDDFQWKMGWHFTVVPRSGVPGTAERMARTHQVPPHLWADYKIREVAQGINTDLAAYSFRNTDEPGETNADRIVQVEILANEADIGNLTEDDYRWLGEFLVRPIMKAHPIAWEYREQYATGACGKLGCNMAWDHPNDKGMSSYEFDNFSGHLGHQDVPENDHTDPGPLDLGKILAYAQGSTPPPTEPTIPLEDALAATLLVTGVI